MPGNYIPGQKRETFNSEAEDVYRGLSLFADDTMVIGTRREIEEGVQSIKEVMQRFEESNNEDKEEELKFGTEESGSIRMLGVWMGPEQDNKNRIKRAGGLWARVLNQMKGSSLPIKTRARIVTACVVSALLFDCSTRTWYMKDLESSPAMDRSLLQTGVVQREGPPAQDDAGPRQEYARPEERDGRGNSEMACRKRSTGKDRRRPKNERLQEYEDSRPRLAEDAGDTP